MSILLSAYYPEGIVFVADKNATIVYSGSAGPSRHVEPTATKVLAWPRNRAIVGYVGLGTLAGLTLDEWMRQFIAKFREFDSIEELAKRLRDLVQSDFDQDYPPGSNITTALLVIHLGGFAQLEGTHVPVMYHVWNHGTIDPRTGNYPPGEPQFQLADAFHDSFMTWPEPHDYPLRVRSRLQNQIDEARFTWFQNGANLGAFYIFTSFVWRSLHEIRDAGFAAHPEGLASRVAFCKMAVEVFGSYFTHHYLPADRVVGGGVDAVYLPWPD